MSKVTVAMSVYANDRPFFVRQAIESILGQTLKDLEFVIVIDGPVGNELKELLASFAGKDKRIRILSNDQNMASFFCMNRVIKVAKSPYIARMDADDISMPQRLERQLEFLEEHRGFDMVGTFAVEIDENGRKIFTKRLPIAMEEIIAWMPRRIPFVATSVFFRRSFFEKVGLYSGKYPTCEDIDLWIRMLAKGVKATNIPEFLVQFRITKDFWKRRRGFRRAWMELNLRIQCIRELPVPRANYAFVPLLFLFRMCPAPIVRLGYMHFR